MSKIKCFKCRTIILNENQLEILSAHGEPMNISSNENAQCGSLEDQKLIYVKYELLPPWMTEAVEESGWTRGKFNCTKCNGKIGSFDFVSGHKCLCGDVVLPQVHLIRSQVDCPRALALPHSIPL